MTGRLAPRSAPTPGVRGVALVRFGSLGDVILATAAATRLKRRRPDLCISMVTRHAFAPILFRHPDVDRVAVLPPGSGGVAGLVTLAGQLRREGVRDLIDLHGNLRSLVLATLLLPRGYVRYDGRGMARRLLVRAKGLARRVDGAPRTVVQAYGAAVDEWLDRFGGVPDVAGRTGPSAHEPAISRLDPDESPRPSVYLAPAEVGWAIAEYGRLEIPPGAIGVAPGARHATKRWPIVYYAELIDRLALRQRIVVPVFLSSSPEDLELETELRRLVRRPESMRIVRQPLRRAAAMLGRLSSLVTNDSALMHLAAAVGTKVVAIFGPTVLDFGFEPAGPGHRILERVLDCRPCSVHGGPVCPKGHFRCMKETSPEDVLAALDQLHRHHDLPVDGGRSDIER